MRILCVKPWGFTVLPTRIKASSRKETVGWHFPTAFYLQEPSEPSQKLCISIPALGAEGELSKSSSMIRSKAQTRDVSSWPAPMWLQDGKGKTWDPSKPSQTLKEFRDLCLCIGQHREGRDAWLKHGFLQRAINLPTAKWNGAKAQICCI